MLARACKNNLITHQDAQKPLETIIYSLPEEQCAFLVSQEFLIVHLEIGWGSDDVFKRFGNDFFERHLLEALGRKRVPEVCEYSSSSEPSCGSVPGIQNLTDLWPW